MLRFSISESMRSESGCRWRPPTSGGPLSVLQPASATAAANAADASSARTKGRRLNDDSPRLRLPQAFPLLIVTRMPRRPQSGGGQPLEQADGERRVNPQPTAPRVPQRLPTDTGTGTRLGQDLGKIRADAANPPQR